MGAHSDHRWSVAFSALEIWETPLSPIKTQCVGPQWRPLWAAPLQLALFLKLEVFGTKTRPSRMTPVCVRECARADEEGAQLIWSCNYSPPRRCAHSGLHWSFYCFIPRIPTLGWKASTADLKESEEHQESNHRIKYNSYLCRFQ